MIWKNKVVKQLNSDFLKRKEKLGLCLYDEQELMSTSEEIFKEEKLFTQHDVENKQWKEENKQLKEENEQLRKENEQLKKKNVVKDATIKESIEKPIEIKSRKEDKNSTDNYYPNWFDRNKFKKILVIISSNKFNYKNKIG